MDGSNHLNLHQRSVDFSQAHKGSSELIVHVMCQLKSIWAHSSLGKVFCISFIALMQKDSQLYVV